jgi:S-adenosylmethionine-dependent methyltransferase
MKKQDRIFDGLAKRFSQRIYDSPKGKIRLAILQDDLQKTINLNKPLKILDMGGGLGQMSIWLAKQGHQVTLCEPASDMLNVAQKSITDLGLTNNVQLSNNSLKRHCTKLSEQYDLIIFHAVLEWLAEPQNNIEILLK